MPTTRQLFSLKSLLLFVCDLTGNPVTRVSAYRMFMIYHLSSLRALDGAAVVRDDFCNDPYYIKRLLLYVLYCVQYHCVCCTVSSITVCVVLCPVSLYVLYCVQYHCMCCTVSSITVCAVLCPVSLCVLYCVQYHCVCCTVSSITVCVVLCPVLLYVLYAGN